MATRCLGISATSKCSAIMSRTALKIMRGSSVPPLFDETTTSAFSKVSPPSARRMRTGDVESSTRNFTPVLLMPAAIALAPAALMPARELPEPPAPPEPPDAPPEPPEPAFAPKLPSSPHTLLNFVTVMGACELPPMPIRYTASKPCFLHLWAKLAISLTFVGGFDAKSVQPMKFFAKSSAFSLKS